MGAQVGLATLPMVTTIGREQWARCSPVRRASPAPYLRGVFVPRFPVSGFEFPFVSQLSCCVLLPAVRRCPVTWVPRLVVCGLTRTGALARATAARARVRISSRVYLMVIPL